MPPVRYFVPNSFTAISLVMGLVSVVQSAHGNFELAAWMILWGSLLDKADGSAARMFNATSEFGVQFDSFADFVAFGIAPAALFYFKLKADLPLSGIAELGVAATCAWYALTLAIRLARFNITTASGDTEFIGLPGTLVGTVFAAAFLAFNKYGLIDRVIEYIPPLLALGGALMISRLRLPKLKPRKNKALNLFQYLNVAAAYILGPLRLFPEYLFGLALSYTLGGVLWCLINPPRDHATQR